MDNQLTAKGWYLSEEGLKSCQVAAGKENATVNDIIKVALNSDLRHICRKQLPDNINNGQVESINGPIVLQVQKVRNVSAPLANQESKGAPRMLKLNLTDGCNHCIAIEFETISSLNTNLIPGTKICLLGSDIPLMKGCILMEENNVKILGGQVEVLKTKWEASKEVIGNKRSGKSNDDPPPAFTEFDSNKPSRGPRSTRRKNDSHDTSRDDRHKDAGAKQNFAKKTAHTFNDEKGINEERPVVKKENQESKRGPERNHNATKKGKDHNDESDYVRGNVKSEYKSLWNGKKASRDDSDKEKGKKVKDEVYKKVSRDESDKDKGKKLKDEAYKETSRDEWDKDKGKKVNEEPYKERKESKDRNSKPIAPSNQRDRDKEKDDSQYRNDTRNADKREPQRDAKQVHGKVIDSDKEKKVSQDYRLREEKSSKNWSNDEYDRKMDRRKGEKTLWSDGKSKEERDSKFQNYKGRSSNDYSYEEYGSRSKETRNPNRNNKDWSRDDRRYNRDNYSERRDQRGSYRNDKYDHGDTRKSDDDHNSRTNGNGWQRRDPERSRGHESESKNDKDAYYQSKKSHYKDQPDVTSNDVKSSDVKSNDVKSNDVKSNDVKSNDVKKPVAYDAQSQNWFYDEEIKNKKESSHRSHEPVSVTFKDEGRPGKEDDDYTLKGNDNDHKDKQYTRKNKNNDYYHDDNRNDGRYDYNKRQQKNHNGYQNNKDFYDRYKNTNRRGYHEGKPNKHYNKNDYSKDNNYDNYSPYGNDRSTYNREVYQSRRQQSDDSHSSRSSRDTAGSNRQRNNEECPTSNELVKSSDDSTSKYSPGKRIPLEVLFGKKQATNDSGVAKYHSIDKPVPTSNVINNQVSSARPNIPSRTKVTSKEIMERSLEQNQNHFNPLSQDVLYMQYPNINQLSLNQDIQYQYPQTIQPVPSFVPPTTQYVGFNEHPGSGSGGTAAVAAAGALNPYFSYPNPRIQYNPQPHAIHTQPPGLQQHIPQQQSQTLANDIQYFSGSPYFYPVSSTQLTPLPEQY